ncbi:Eukaryotic translation initiation factor 3 subunit J [Smittium culicis]|uniref:Eukaryotic translation initiation factor 3 30 kDa subunit n=1 Tax=Smittium culicis TaxID=133412 RepID=A0A1R1WZZ3_9FUNG|nr:Eukaryotic translation initiation factor 3 subunit J [Smittium culicis]
MASLNLKKKAWEEEESSDSDIKDNWDDSDEESEQESEEEVEQVQEEDEEPAPLSKRDIERNQIIDSDIQNTEDLFSGLNVTDVSFKNAFSNLNPKTEKDFDEFRKALVQKISKLGSQKNYPAFVNNFVKDLVAPLTDTEAAKVQRSVGVIVTEKQKAARNTAKTKKGAKKSVVTTVSKGKYDMDDYSNGYDDFDDFM